MKLEEICSKNEDRIVIVDDKLCWMDSVGRPINPNKTALFFGAKIVPTLVVDIVDLPDKVYISGDSLFTTKQEAEEYYHSIMANCGTIDNWVRYRPVEYFARRAIA